MYVSANHKYGDILYVFILQRYMSLGSVLHYMLQECCALSLGTKTNWLELGRVHDFADNTCFCHHRHRLRSSKILLKKLALF